MPIAMRFFALVSAMIVMIAFGMMACSDKNPVAAAASEPLKSEPATTPSTQVLGTVPAGPTANAAANTSPAKSDMSQTQQSSAMPMTGQANDHSVLGPKPVDKSSGK